MTIEQGALKDLTPKVSVVRVGDEDITISPMRVGTWAAFLTVAKPFLDGITAPDNSEVGMGTLLEHPEALVEAVSVATKLSRAKIEALFPDEFAALLQAVLTVNADFFTQKIQPAFTKLVDAVTAATKGGESSSNS